MKRFAAVLVLVSAMCVSVFAQSLVDEIIKIKQIKLLESTREDVGKVLAAYQGKYDEVRLTETFTSAKIAVEVTYTTGICADDSPDVGAWNVGRGKVDFIDISFREPVKFADLNYKPSDFRKERLVADGKEGFIYHDKSLGIVFILEGEKITSMFFTPSKNQISLLCKNKESKTLRDFYSRETYLP